jgi:DNA mismatch endonuclease, patch repair protein
VTRMQNNMNRKPMTRSEIMRQVGGKNSAAERALRSALHAAGLRFRLHRRVEGVVADIVFPGSRVLVFVDGCFWHGCPRHATFPKTNTGYWLPKLAENKDRDRRQSARFRKCGWKVFRVWEHDCLLPRTGIVAKILAACRKGDAQR